MILFNIEVGKQACTYAQSTAAACRHLSLDKVTGACTQDNIELFWSVVAASDAAGPTDDNNIQMEQVYQYDKLYSFRKTTIILCPIPHIGSGTLSTDWLSIIGDKLGSTI